MSAEYSVEEVRDMAKAMKVASCVSFHPDYAKDPEHRVWSDDASNMLTAYANRIEADESAVPVAKIRHFRYSGIARNGFSQEAQMLDGAPELPDGTELFTHPPAQVAQVSNSLTAALNVLEDGAVHGLQLHGDDIRRFRALPDRIAPAADPVAQPSPDAADSVRVVDEDERVSAFNKWWEEHKAAHPVNVGDKARAIAAWIASRTVALQDAALAAQGQSAASPVGVPDGWVLVPRELTAENGAKAALIGEFQIDVEDCGRIRKFNIGWPTIKHIYASAIAHFSRSAYVSPTHDMDWAVGRWMAEVRDRPLRNAHRRSLDDVWRQVIRHFGGDDVVVCGPRHDDLLAAAVPQPGE